MWYLITKQSFFKMEGEYAVEKLRSWPSSSPILPGNMVPHNLVVDLERDEPAMFVKPSEPLTHPLGAWVWVEDNLDSEWTQKLLSQGCKRIYLKVWDDLGTKVWDQAKLIPQLKKMGFEVWGWGYHFTENKVRDAKVTAGLLKPLGLDGYVVDVEAEVETTNAVRRDQLKTLLIELQKVFPGTLGNTTFGWPQYHQNIPWDLLELHTDFHFPQIYTEKWSFRKTDLEEAKEAIRYFRENLDFKKPILPIFGSESDAKNPASADTLQALLNAYPGSSVWRVPNKGEFGRAYELEYGPMEAKPVVKNVATLKRTADTLGGKWAGLTALELTIGNEEFVVTSGTRSKQNFRLPEDPNSVPGNLEPIPQGRYRIGQIEWQGGKDNYSGSFGPGLGPVWVPIVATFWDNRGAFGFHLDSNIEVGPGSAGCVVLRSLEELKRFVSALRKFDPEFLDVQWGLESKAGVA